jgi:hypothetical protein
MFCPKVGNQDKIGSCVGWATGYGAMTIATSISNNQNDNNGYITDNAYSALFIYNQIKSTGDCDGGSYIGDALDLVKSKGDCFWREFDSENVNECNKKPTAADFASASNFYLKEYYSLFSTKESLEKKINIICQSLASNKPVIVALGLTKNFFNLNRQNYVWKPQAGQPIVGYHALVIIGYDLGNKTFEVMNSWGDWGNHGFFKIRFDDLANTCVYAYSFILDSKRQVNETKLTGDFQFLKYQITNTPFQEIGVKFENNIYKATQVNKVLESFRLIAKNISENSYVYVFSIDANNKAEIHFPKTESSNTKNGFGFDEVPIIPSKDAKIIIPSKNTILQISHAGTDHLCILYSKEKIENIQDRIKKVKESNVSDNFYSRFLVGFNDILALPNEINYNQNKMSFTANVRITDKTKAIPIILEVRAIE